MAVVSNFVGEIRHLGLQSGGFGIETLALAGMIVTGVMLDQTLAHFPTQIQTGEEGIFLFDFLNDAQAMPIMFEAAVFFHQAVQDHLSFMTEWRVPQVVSQSNRFSEIFVQS